MHLQMTILLAIALCLTTGCSGMLPVAKTTDEARWDTFDLIIPFATTQKDLQQLGFDPYETSNIKILNYLTIIDKFMPNTNITMSDLPPGLRGCVEATDSCVAYEMKIHKIKEPATGQSFS